MNNVVISANFGNYDNIVEEHYPNPGWDFIMFTDNDIESKTWQIKKIKPIYEARKQARFYKWLLHRFVVCEYSLWIDASVQILTDLNTLIEKYLKDTNIAMYRHRCRNCIYEEGKICKDSKLDSTEIIDKQLTKYKEQGYPLKAGLNETEVILRRCTPQIKELNELVWNEIYNGSIRDQLAFDWAVWSLGIRVNNFEGMIKLYPKARKVLEVYFGKIEYKNPYFELKEHKN